MEHCGAGASRAAAGRTSSGPTTRSRTAASSPAPPARSRPPGSCPRRRGTSRALASQGYVPLPSSVIASLSCLACVVPAVRGFLVIIFLVSAACLRFAGSLPACCSTSSSSGDYQVHHGRPVMYNEECPRTGCCEVSMASRFYRMVLAVRLIFYDFHNLLHMFNPYTCSSI